MLIRGIAAGKISRDAVVARTGTSVWTALLEVPAFAEAVLQLDIRAERAHSAGPSGPGQRSTEGGGSLRARWRAWNPSRHFVVIALVTGAAAVALVLYVATGGLRRPLSKEEARRLIAEKYYADDSSVFYRWGGHYRPSGAGKERVFKAMEEHAACIDALEKAGIVVREKCYLLGSFREVRCTDNNFRLGSKGSYEEKYAALSFPCGTKSLGDVTSVITEDRKAIVKYAKSVATDGSLLSTLSACEGVVVPTDGAQDAELKFTKDDDGRWSVE